MECFTQENAFFFIFSENGGRGGVIENLGLQNTKQECFLPVAMVFGILILTF